MRLKRRHLIASLVFAAVGLAACYAVPADSDVAPVNGDSDEVSPVVEISPQEEDARLIEDGLADVPASEIEASVMATYAVESATMTPDGSYLLTARTDSNSTEMCGIDLDAQTESCITGLATDGFPLSGNTIFRWSPDSRYVAWLTFDQDVWVFDRLKEVLIPISDDGMVDTQPENLGKGLRDSFPLWVSDQSVAFIRYDPEVLTGSVVLADVSGGTQVFPGPTVEHEFRGVVSDRGLLGYLPPHQVDQNSLIFSTSAGFYSLALDTGVFSLVFDQEEAYQPIFDGWLNGGFQTSGQFAIVDAAPNGDLVLLDIGVHIAYGQGAWSAMQGGAFAFPADQPGFEPLFRAGTLEEGHLAPLTLGLSPDGSKLAFWWLDNANLDSDGRPMAKLSITDFPQRDLIDVRTANEVWAGSGAVFFDFGGQLSWTTNDRLLVVTGDEVHVIQLHD